MKRENIFDVIENDVKHANISESTKNWMLSNILRLRKQKVNIMVTGATGSGKSSTINAMFDTSVAKVGTGADPETMEITRYDLDNLIMWDGYGYR